MVLDASAVVRIIEGSPLASEFQDAVLAADLVLASSALLAMAVTPYRVTAARIGNSSGLRLPTAFYRDHPQFAGAAGHVEVLDDNTLLWRLEPQDQQQAEAEEDSLMLRLFLDFLSRQALASDRGLVLYTETMAADDELLAGAYVVDTGHCGVALPGTAMTRHRADLVFIKANKNRVDACGAEQTVFGSTHEGSQ
jgi:antitoxin PrlF